MLLVANLANTRWCKILWNDWNTGKCPLTWEYSVRAIQWVPTSQGLDGFQKYLRPCALDKSSRSVGRVKTISQERVQIGLLLCIWKMYIWMSVRRSLGSVLAADWAGHWYCHNHLPPMINSYMNNFPERVVLLEDVARGLQSSLGEVILGGHPTGMSYLFYYTEQNTKHERGKNYKHQRFWTHTRCLPYWTCFTGRCCYGLIDKPVSF